MSVMFLCSIMHLFLVFISGKGHKNSYTVPFYNSTSMVYIHVRVCGDCFPILFQCFLLCCDDAEEGPKWKTLIGSITAFHSFAPNQARNGAVGTIDFPRSLLINSQEICLLFCQRNNNDIAQHED